MGVLSAATETDGTTPPRPSAVIHLDLDGASAIYRWRGWPWEHTDDTLFESGLRNALEFFDAHGVIATLFVIARDLEFPSRRRLVEDAVARGHEIASHSLTHRPLTRLSTAEKRHELEASRLALTQTLGTPVRGFRAPGFDIDREVLGLLAETGYEYDTSLFPRARLAARLGLDAIAPRPHRIFDDRPFLELPLPHRPGLPAPFHPCYSLVLGEWYFRLGLGGVRHTGEPLVLLFHLTDFAEPLPPEVLRGPMSRIFTLSFRSAADKTSRCHRMLDATKDAYTITDTRTLLTRYGARS